MAGIETEAYRQVRHLRRKLAHDVQFLKPAAELRARADGVLDQQHQLAITSGRRGVADSFEEVQDSLLDGLTLIIAGVRHQVFGADGDGALQLAAERLDRI